MVTLAPEGVTVARDARRVRQQPIGLDGLSTQAGGARARQPGCGEDLTETTGLGRPYRAGTTPVTAVNPLLPHPPRRCPPRAFDYKMCPTDYFPHPHNAHRPHAVMGSRCTPLSICKTTSVHARQSLHALTSHSGKL